MLFTKLQILNIFLNLGVILVGVGLIFLTIKLTKLKSAQTRLIFILYTIYWVPTLMCRDYTALLAEHVTDNFSMISIMAPLVLYGVIGLVWRPAVDILSFKMKSRRNIIFIALGIQLLTFIPFVIVPNFATNMVQTIGCGVGASCIGLFNLMFDDREKQQSVFATVSILAIAPILAQFFASAIETMVACQIPAIYTHEEYANVMLGIWSIGVVLIVACFVIAFFVKPRPKLLYIAKKQKTVVKTKKQWWAYILICIAAMLVLFVRWTSAGPTVGLQLTYIAAHFGKDTRFYEGYTGLIYTVGQLFGTILTGYLINKTKHEHHNMIRMILVISSCVIGCMYSVLGGFFLDVASFMGLLALNGFSYGLIYPVIVGIVVKKVFAKVKYFTPVGLLNTFFALGITFGAAFVSYYKAPVFDQIHGFSTVTFNDFRLANWHIMLVNGVMLVLVIGCYLLSSYLHKKQPEKLVVVKNKVNLMEDSEM